MKDVSLERYSRQMRFAGIGEDEADVMRGE